MKQLILRLLVMSTVSSMAQVGINTTDPKGTLDVTSVNNTGLVLPRVSSVEDVTDGNGNAPVEGTTVYDLSRNTTCFYQNGDWVCIDTDSNGDPILIDPTDNNFDTDSTIDYLKASNTDANDYFGASVSISADGNTLAIGGYNEDSNGNEVDNSISNSGAVYIFSRVGNIWTQEAYLKASNLDVDDRFGFSISLSDDGNTLAVGTSNEDSNGIEGDNSLSNSGAAYIFIRTGSNWTQQAYLKASNLDESDFFGRLSLSGDGNTLAVGAANEDSNGNENDNSISSSGAVYVFSRSGATWTQEAYLKASNIGEIDQFGFSLSISEDGNTLAVGANRERSSTTGINGNETDNSLNNAGAVYVFSRVGTTWNQEAYIKASNTGDNDQFGYSIALAADGNTLVVGATGEDSAAIGINGNEGDNSANNAGAVYIFVKSGGGWSQEAYIKASNASDLDNFGRSVNLSSNGNKMIAGTFNEDSNAIGINGDQDDNSANSAGAVYLFTRSEGVWNQEAYIKASNTDAYDYFGQNAVISGNGQTIVVGSILEDSNATGINGDQTDNSANDAGAVYVYTAE